MFFFFFKQKTAYEMRISDWSSDVCSSDLSFLGLVPILLGRRRADGEHISNLTTGNVFPVFIHQPYLVPLHNFARTARHNLPRSVDDKHVSHFCGADPVENVGISKLFPAARSEEHTSELQSLMRISYA